MALEFSSIKSADLARRSRRHVVVALAALLAVTIPARAAVFTVTNLNDAGAGAPVETPADTSVRLLARRPRMATTYSAI